MKLFKNNSLFICTIVLLLSSCGGSSNSGTPADTEQANVTIEPGWTIDSLTFKAGPNAIAQLINPGSLSNVGITGVSTEGLDTTNGAYSGSRIDLQYTRNGTGTYTVVDNLAGVLDSNAANPDLNVVYFTIQAGTLSTNPAATTMWKSTNGTLDITVDANDIYHFSTSEALPLTRLIDVGAGVEGAPDDINVTIQDVFGQ